jgi:hypothetical protein
VLGAEFGPAKIPILAPHGYDTQRALEMAGIHRHIRVGQEYFQPKSAHAHVLQCLDERRARAQAMLFELSIDPVEERIDPRLAVS